MGRKSKAPRITGGDWKGRPLIGGVPKGVRPTSSRVREALGSLLASHFMNAYVLDAFAGAGLFSAEALSRRAEKVMAFDKNALAVKAIKKSLANLDEDIDILLRCGDVLHFLRRPRPPEARPFDMVFVDPPYESNLVIPTLTFLVLGAWVHPDSPVVVESDFRSGPISPPEGLAIRDSRRYGDTQISVYSLTQSGG